MKILMPVSSYPVRGYPGWAPFVKETALALARKGHEVIVLVFHPEGRRLEYFETEHASVKVIAYPVFPWKSKLHAEPGLMPSLRRSFRACCELPFYLLRSAAEILRASSLEKPDFIHAFWYLPMGFLAALLKPFHKKPVVISALGGDLHLPEFPFTGLLKFTASRADLNIACSRYLAEQAKKLSLSTLAFTVVPNGVPTGKFQEARTQSPDFVTLACVKRLVPEKNIAEVLRAVKKIRPEILASLRLRIAGEGPEKPRLIQLAQKLRLEETVSFEGFITPQEMPHFLAGADILIDPSAQEGFATSNLEALAAGCLVIASNSVGNPEMIKSGWTGYLYPAGDLDALAGLIESCVSDSALRGRIAQTGQRETVKRFDLSVIADLLHELYSGLPCFKRAAPTSQSHLQHIPR